MLKRIISGIILIGIILGVIFIDWVCALTVTVFIAIGLYEFFAMLEQKGISTYRYLGIGIGTLIPVSIMFRFVSTPRRELLFIVLALVFLILMQLISRQNTGATVGISTTLFGILYISWFFSFLIKIRYMESGLGLLSSILLMTKLGDIGAYFIGSHFGRLPLMPSVSPKKTVEGAIAGLIFSIVGALVSRPFLRFSYPHLLLLGASFGILGQLGDLSESLIKRDCQVKDAGKILPGMGGILDEIDSLFFTAPVFYFYMSVVLRYR